MRIDQNAGTQRTQDSTEAAASRSRGATAAAVRGELTGDTAQLSVDQVRVQGLAAQVSALPEIRQERVAALGQAVQNGSYRVSPEQTAEAVIAELLARPAAA